MANNISSLVKQISESKIDMLDITGNVGRAIKKSELLNKTKNLMGPIKKPGFGERLKEAGEHAYGAAKKVGSNAYDAVKDSGAAKYAAGAAGVLGAGYAAKKLLDRRRANKNK